MNLGSYLDDRLTAICTHNHCAEFVPSTISTQMPWHLIGMDGNSFDAWYRVLDTSNIQWRSSQMLEPRDHQSAVHKRCEERPLASIYLCNA